MQFVIALLLFPLSVFYGIITKVRNLLFNFHILKSKHHNKQDLLVISVGNIRAGGTGKTPFVEYLLNSLKANHHIAVISRGYGRKTKGFRIINDTDTAKSVGDEPLQMYRKFNHDALFAVSEDRVTAIENITSSFPDISLIILDDAFQHRYAQSDISFLLTAYSKPFFKDFVIPFGYLREYRSGYRRADYIVVTKTPSITQAQKAKIITQIKPLPAQQVFFSNITYKEPYLISNPDVKINNLQDHSVILLSGIADNQPLISYLASQTQLLEVISFKDHHKFSPADLQTIKHKIETQQKPNTILITTEKDATRLDDSFIELIATAVYVISIEFEMDETFNAVKQSLNRGHLI
ncbi:MAG: tetraacyldisaccharide 4'-kinase [Bacteroidales bacterium]|jgi:tetraacyldisaccharide 4'-kinase|nr:tetraacyldisaccharide 4'-kinase [Bacteroidales bacterium]